MLDYFPQRYIFILKFRPVRKQIRTVGTVPGSVGTVPGTVGQSHPWIRGDSPWNGGDSPWDGGTVLTLGTKSVFQDYIYP